VVVVAQPGKLAAAPDVGAELGSALGQQAIGGGLRDAQDVRMRGVQPAGRGLVEATRVSCVVVPERGWVQVDARLHQDDPVRSDFSTSAGCPAVSGPR